MTPPVTSTDGNVISLYAIPQEIARQESAARERFIRRLATYYRYLLIDAAMTNDDETLANCADASEVALAKAEGAELLQKHGELLARTLALIAALRDVKAAFVEDARERTRINKLRERSRRFYEGEPRHD